MGVQRRGWGGELTPRAHWLLVRAFLAAQVGSFGMGHGTLAGLATLWLGCHFVAGTCRWRIMHGGRCRWNTPWHLPACKHERMRPSGHATR